MTAAEVRLLLETVTPNRRLLYQVTISSGLRAGELRALRVRHLDSERGGLQLEAAWTKGRRAGFQPLPRWLVSELENVAAGKPTDAPLLRIAQNSARLFSDDMERAKIPKETPAGVLDFHSLLAMLDELRRDDRGSADRER